MCLDRITRPRPVPDVLYGLLRVFLDGQVWRWVRSGIPFDVDSDGWEYANQERILYCGDEFFDEQLKMGAVEYIDYHSGFHLYESLEDAVKCVKRCNCCHRVIVVGFAWQEIEAQGTEVSLSCKTNVPVTVVHARKGLGIMWDSKYDTGGQ